MDKKETGEDLRASKRTISVPPRKKLFEMLYKIYNRLPSSLKRCVAFILKPAYSGVVRISSIASNTRMPVYLLSGKEKVSGDCLNALICAKEMSAAYLSGLIYNEKSSPKVLGKKFIWKVTSRIRPIQPMNDLTIVEFERIFSALFKQQGFILIPKWVLFTLDISNPLPEIMKSIKNKSLDNNLRKIKRYKYSYEITREPAKFEFFYQHMYLPYAVKRFGKSTWVFNYSDLTRLLYKGQLLLVKQGDEYLAGVLLVERDRGLFSHSIGVKDGNIEYVERGAISASYYFTILWAKQEGYGFINFGYSRPFLNDGVFIYKKRWGMAIKKQNHPLGIFGIKVNNFSQSVRAFIAANPFIFAEEDKIKSLIYTERNQLLCSEDIKFLMRKYHVNGLDNIIIISPYGFTQRARETAETLFPRMLSLSSLDLEEFFEQLSNSRKQDH